jgi:hypothetical protein
VTRQNLGQHQGKGFSTAATLPAIGTKHALTTSQLTAGLGGIVAAQKTVPVQGFSLAAAGAALLLEGKSRVFNSSWSRTK